MNECSENPYLAPTSEPLPEMPSSGYYPLATLGQRFLGSLIDGIVMTPVLWGLSWAVSKVTHGGWDIWEASNPYPALLVSWTISVIIFIIFNGWLLAKNGQTIGKLLVRTKIVSMNGTKPSLINLILIRTGIWELVFMLPQVGIYFILMDSLFVFRKSRRCLHDSFAGTKVVKVDPEPLPGSRPIRSGYTNVDVENPVPTLAGIFWRRLDIDVKRLPMHAAFLEDLEIAKSDLDPALHELCRAFPTKNPDEIKSARTLAELLEVLKIEPENLGKLTR